MTRAETGGVLMIAERYLPDVGGTELQLARLAAQLTARGVRVEVVTPRLYRHLPKVERAAVTIHRLTFPPIRYAGAIMVPLSLAWFLVRHARRFETYHTHTVGTLAVVTTVIGRLLGKRVVLKAVGFWELEHGILDPGRRRRPWVRASLAILRGATVWVAVSSALQRAIVAAGVPSSRVRRVPNGVDTRRFTPGDRCAARTQLGMAAAGLRVVFAGRLEEVKSLPTLLAAWRAVVDKVPDATLDLVGEGSLASALRAECRRLDVEDSVFFHGRQADVAPYFRAADCFVLPSRVEGLSNTLLEAMAVGLAVVGTRVSGTEDMVEDGVNGVLVEPGDADALAAAIVGVLVDPERAATLGRRACADVRRRCSLEAVTDAYVDLYRSPRP